MHNAFHPFLHSKQFSKCLMDFLIKYQFNNNTKITTVCNDKDAIAKHSNNYLRYTQWRTLNLHLKWGCKMHIHNLGGFVLTLLIIYMSTIFGIF